MATSKIQLVCFDWGGVILKHCRSWREGCAAAGLPVREPVENGKPLDAAEYVQIRRKLTQDFQRGLITQEEFFPALAAANDHLYTHDELVRIHDAWLLDEYPGIQDVIQRLCSRQDVETALLSNTNEAHWARHIPKSDGTQADYPTAGLLKHRHASHLLGLAKPDAAIYEAFEREVGVRGASILFFDDLAENIEQAQRLGWTCVHVDYTGDTAQQVGSALRSYGLA